ncbi:MAG: hypothetical protein WC924_01115 [Candidatus Gracilibacteria bacterium]
MLPSAVPEFQHQREIFLNRGTDYRGVCAVKKPAESAVRAGELPGNLVTTVEGLFLVCADRDEVHGRILRITRWLMQGVIKE